MNRLGAKLKASLRPRSKSRSQSTSDTKLDSSASAQGSNSSPNSQPKTPAVSTVPAFSKAVDASSARSTKLWNEAMDSLSDEERAILVGTSKPDSKLDLLQNMLNAAEKREIECQDRKWKIKLGSGREIVVADKATKIVQWLGKFKAIGDLAVSYDPNHAALPWAGIKFLLEAAVADTEAKAALLVALERMIYLIGRCRIYERLFLDDGKAVPLGPVERQLEATLTKLYTLILRFLCATLGYYDKNAISRTYDALLNQSGVQEFLSDMEYSEERVHRDASNCSSAQSAAALNELLENGQEVRDLLNEWKDPIMRTAAGVADIQDNLSQEKREKILTWISRIEYARLHHTARENRIEGTGKWILDHAGYLEWKKSDQSMILWLHGVPGAGKTKLTSTVVDDFLIHESKLNTSHALAYFYCDRNRSDLRNHENIMNSILRQLATVEEGGSILPPVLELHEDKRKSAFASGSPFFDETAAVLPDVLSRRQRATIIIDALDECEPKARRKLIAKLQWLTKELNHASSAVAKIFISSRRDQDIAEALNNSTKLAIEATDNREDIARFLSERTDELSLRSALQEEICSTLQDKSEGVFQWVALQIYRVEELAPIEKDIRKYLGKLPKDLKEAYDEIFSRITTQSDTRKDIAERTFQWVACSVRPLRADEIVAAVCQDPNTTEVDPVEEGIDVEFILGACHNLLIIDPHSNTCRFSHLSVQEYIETSHWNQTQSNGTVAKVSLSILNHPGYWDDEEESLPHGVDGVVSYVETNWHQHVKQHGEEDIDPQLTTLLRKFLGSMNEAAPAYVSWIMREPDRPGYGDMMPGSRSSLGIAFYGFHAVLSDWWEAGFDDIDERNARGSTLLTLAARQGSLSVAATLVEKGANVNATCTDYSTPIRAAALSGVKEMVDLLLEAGADVNESGGGSDNPLIGAVRGRNNEIVKLMLDRGADPTAFSTNNSSAISVAAWAKEEDMVRLMLDHGADANAPSGHFGYPLAAAAAGGDKEVVELLLERGADINAAGGKYGCALGSAILRRNKGIAELLIERGADVNIRGGHYGSPLGVAAGMRSLDIAELLLDNGADVNAPGGDFSSPLEAASIEDVAGARDVVKLLLEKGADPNAKGGKYGGPLGAAVRAPRFASKEMVEILLDAGANVDGPGGELSPLYLARKRRNDAKRKDIIDALVNRGAKSPILEAVSSPAKKAN